MNIMNPQISFLFVDVEKAFDKVEWHFLKLNIRLNEYWATFSVINSFNLPYNMLIAVDHFFYKK